MTIALTECEVLASGQLFVVSVVILVQVLCVKVFSSLLVSFMFTIYFNKHLCENYSQKNVSD